MLGRPPELVEGWMLDRPPELVEGWMQNIAESRFQWTDRTSFFEVEEEITGFSPYSIWSKNDSPFVAEPGGFSPG